MKSIARSAFLAVLLAISGTYFTAAAESGSAGQITTVFEADEFDWAYGMVVDTISVTGNVKTKSFALLRELESREGTQLNRVALARDHRYLTDMSSVATVVIAVYPRREGHCGLVLHVTERPMLLLKLVYPIVEYNFNNQRFRFGLKINDRNFRRRLESFSIGYTHNSVGDDNASASWTTDWIGWKHVGVGVWASYFRRGTVGLETSVLEQWRAAPALSLPLTESRIAFARVIGGLTLAENRRGKVDSALEDEVLISPSLGFAYDTRDSPLKPNSGGLFYLDLQSNRILTGNGSTYYLLRNDLRLFRNPLKWTVLALHSNFLYQFGEYPEYIRFGLGGAGNLRGYGNGEFVGNHLWTQSLEVRLSPFPTWIFSVPYAKYVDVGVMAVAFVDGGIVWSNESDFDPNRWRVGYGVGLRVFSPFQDAVRVDLGFNPDGEAVFYFGTGMRF